MMERLIGNQFPFETLQLQNRMRPEFSAQLLDIYPQLQDNLERVKKNKPADGLVKSMLFWNHHEKEVDGRSFSNPEEARRAVVLAEYLMATGIKPGQITVLAAYQGQVAAVRKLMRSRGGFNMESKNPEDRVQVSTIDMFQGDENDFIIVSLVRSNPRGAIGFLAEQSRRCVAQSRARCGMYLLGSESTLTAKSTSAWVPLLDRMNDLGCVSDTIAVQCPKHKEKSVVNICDADAFEKLMTKPEKFCKEQCGYKYPCGLHLCTKPCLPAHAHASCMSMVTFTHSACGHEGKRRCYENVRSLLCQKQVVLNFVCGHNTLASCIQKQEHDRGVKTKLCTAKVDCVLPACGHKITKPCHAKASHSVCNSVVYYKGACGHNLSRECHMPDSQVRCDFQPCAKPRRCGHPCVNKCGEPCDQGDCSVCKEEKDAKVKQHQDKAKMKVKRLREQIRETGVSFSRNPLDEGSAEYLSVHDRVTKYVLPMHNWYPRITKIEKVENLERELLFEEYKTQAFSDYAELKFHGTDDAGVEGITKGGFRIGKPGMYGAGIYFATDSSKSSQEIYTKGSNKLLLCDVLLGNAKEVHSADNSLTGQRLKKEGFDSVFAPRNTKDTGGVLNDEFVVFDPRQAVVRYVIHYSHSSQPSLTAGLPGANISQMSGVGSGQAFKKVLLKPDRTVNTQDPLENTYRFAEGHFHRMMMKYSGASKIISGITIAVNTKLAANFEKKRNAFTSNNKGWFFSFFSLLFLPHLKVIPFQHSSPVCIRVYQKT
jgi:hypothetical protein